MQGQHGESYHRTPTYNTWLAMRSRCNTPTYWQYKDYGGRGIKVCARWDSYQNFLADMGYKPAGLTLERNDNNGDYEPGNCRWATRKEQAANRRKRDDEIDVRGESLQAFARRIGMKYSTVYYRLKLAGWTLDQIEATSPALRNKVFRYGKTGRV